MVFFFFLPDSSYNNCGWCAIGSLDYVCLLSKGIEFYPIRQLNYWHILLRLSGFFWREGGWICFGFVSQLSIWSPYFQIWYSLLDLYFLGSLLNLPCSWTTIPVFLNLVQPLVFLLSSQPCINYSLLQLLEFCLTYVWASNHPQMGRESLHVLWYPALQIPATLEFVQTPMLPSQFSQTTILWLDSTSRYSGV